MPLIQRLSMALSVFEHGSLMPFLTLLTTLSLLQSAHAQPSHIAAEPSVSEPRLIAATFRSNWCGPCRILEPRFDSVMQDYADASIEEVRFDFSFGRRGRLAERAAEEGISEVYARSAGSTGYVLLIDRETQDVLAHITVRYADGDIRGAIEHALAIIEDRQDRGL